MKPQKMDKIVNLMTVIVPLLIIACVIVLKVIPEHNTRWIIGKTEAEIVERYGEFDRVHGSWCFYVTKESHVGFLGTDPEEYLGIKFDANGIAYECFEQVGWYGG